MTVDRRAMLLLAVGHGCVDFCQGAVPAILPFLLVERGYSLAGASALVLATTVSSSLLQPLLGHLSDRRTLAILMPAGLATAGIGLGVVGMVSDPLVAFTALFVSGAGVAAYHPEATRYAHYASRSRRAMGMSVFSAGGHAGLVVGPILVTPAILLMGLKGIAVVAALPVLWAVVMAWRLGYLSAFRVPTPGHRREQGVDDWPMFLRLTGVIAIRSVLAFGMVTFVPLYFVEALHRSKPEANAALTLMLAAGAIGTLMAGAVAERWGRRTVLVATLALLTPLILAFSFADARMALILCLPIGAGILATTSLTVVMGQEYLPTRLGVASGVTLGLGIGLGGAVAPLLGLLAEAVGLATMLQLLALVAVVAAVLAVTLRDVVDGRPWAMSP